MERPAGYQKSRLFNLHTTSSLWVKTHKEIQNWLDVNPILITVEYDETNNGEVTHYYFDGVNLVTFGGK